MSEWDEWEAWGAGAAGEPCSDYDIGAATRAAEV